MHHSNYWFVHACDFNSLTFQHVAPDSLEKVKEERKEMFSFSTYRALDTMNHLQLTVSGNSTSEVNPWTKKIYISFNSFPSRSARDTKL